MDIHQKEKLSWQNNQTESKISGNGMCTTMETIQAILALVPIKGLKIQQMDVKGDYLNGQLREKAYMCQPKGYEDETGWVCELI